MPINEHPPGRKMNFGPVRKTGVFCVPMGHDSSILQDSAGLVGLIYTHDAY